MARAKSLKERKVDLKARRQVKIQEKLEAKQNKKRR